MRRGLQSKGAGGDFPSSWVKRGHVYFHPRDNNPSVYPAALTKSDPATFIPDQSQFPDGRVRTWGLVTESEGTVESFMAAVQAQNCYCLMPDSNPHDFPAPYEQFCSVLAAKKLETKDSEEVLSAMDKILVIKVALEDGAEDYCWRRFRVPASTPLNILHDQILTPIMGWARAYHGYVFEDPRDGAVLGPAKNSGYIDMMHAGMHFHYVMDDRKVPLACLLRAVGDVCYYTYDLGDGYHHKLTVEEVLDSEDRSVALLDGVGACPPEDSTGLGDGSGSDAYAEFMTKFKKNPKSCQKGINAAQNAVNYRSNWLTGSPLTFEPGRFNLNFHRVMLEAMVAGPTVQKPKCTGIDKFVEKTNECAGCGDRLKPLSKCARCKKASYCSRECQKADWKR
jgi:hypothetical protein